MRYSLREISLLRIFNGITRRFFSIPSKIAWHFSKSSKLNRFRLKKFKNIHKGKRCFLVANGPSLKKMNLEFLNNEISFGLNRIYLAYDDMKFTNNYLVSINSLVLSQFGHEIKNLKITKFVNWDSRKHFSKSQKNIFFIYKSIFGKSFGKNISKSLNPAATVTYAALQIIYYMGFKEVIIIGMDHNFKTKSKNKPNKIELRTETIDENHFNPNYFPKGSKWETPDLVSSEFYYKLAKKEFEKNDRLIVDCTIGGKCNIFSKGNIQNYVQNSK